MNDLHLQIRWKGMEKDPVVEAYLQDKLSKLLEFNFVNSEETFKAEVVYYEKSNKYKSSLAFGVKGKPGIYAESGQFPNLQHSINELVEKSLDQLRRIKTQFKK
ncbi:ribosome-associated translation inhibitor RaiA [Mycoplasmoides fastidiosum]|uniref:Ribosome-associated translation inhibitor RaiA n=1 Tax=Mycoplasmoides fastidiosum TaxID=92758 RepID=A0ABU0LYF2_9BACT|nr:HPF/RaiA family ribosome-associated protein [Mycoplasmoides fastidiosum]MDQ0513719.1 ribosome-associated translation inhibitor RaiA [Mycoplasmoides fastidiosum]UUD37858.1 HPF/RaiA family ribosome-associated protein [Mycoplasmoides fastidiosum]